MMARLAFAVSPHVDADILLADEILGVGDALFQQKCQHKMAELVQGGVTLVFVSHDPGAVVAHCDRAIWLENGQIQEDGAARDVVNRRVESPIFGFIIRNEQGQNLFGDNTYLTYSQSPVSVKPGQRITAKLSFIMPYLPNGRYSLAPSVIERKQQNHVHLDWLEDALSINVFASPVRGGRIGLALSGIGFSSSEKEQN